MVKKPEVKKKPNLKWMRDKDREMVRGIFRFHEVPGGTLSFSFKAYKEDPVENFTFTDGDVYTIPLGVARHLNNNCNYPIHAFAQDADGKNVVKVGHKVQRVSFQSLEFVDIDDIGAPSNLVTVEAEQPNLSF
jgi:hypothetical protein